MTDDDIVPVSIRLGEVVPPEDPEDWTRPLTWLAALGMLAAPLLATLWFTFDRPSVTHPVALTWALAATIGAGAALTGATQAGRPWAFAGTLGAGLFAALATVIVGLAFSGERQVAVASPTLSHAFLGSTAGLAGSGVASLVAIFASALATRFLRWALAAAAAAGTIVLVAVLA